VYSGDLLWPNGWGDGYGFIITESLRVLVSGLVQSNNNGSSA